LFEFSHRLDPIQTFPRMTKHQAITRETGL
jgi:hypothetical protein